MIIGFIGTVGQGKTLSMTREAYKYYQRGFSVYANFKLDFPHTKLNKTVFEEMIQDKETLQDCILLLDELHIWLDSRSSGSKKNKAISYFILQTRKRNVRLLYTTQHFHQVDKRLRSTTDIIVQCRNLTNQSSLVKEGSENIPQIFENHYYHQYSDNPSKSFVFDGRSVFGLYDTSEIIDFSDE